MYELQKRQQRKQFSIISRARNRFVLSSSLSDEYFDLKTLRRRLELKIFGNQAATFDDFLRENFELRKPTNVLEKKALPLQKLMNQGLIVAPWWQQFGQNGYRMTDMDVGLFLVTMSSFRYEFGILKEVGGGGLIIN